MWCVCVCVCVHVGDECGVCVCVCVCDMWCVHLSVLEYIEMLKETSLACVLLPFRRFYFVSSLLAAGCFKFSYIQHGSVQLSN